MGKESQSYTRCSGIRVSSCVDGYRDHNYRHRSRSRSRSQQSSKSGSSTLKDAASKYTAPIRPDEIWADILEPNHSAMGTSTALELGETDCTDEQLQHPNKLARPRRSSSSAESMCSDVIDEGLSKVLQNFLYSQELNHTYKQQLEQMRPLQQEQAAVTAATVAAAAAAAMLHGAPEKTAPAPKSESAAVSAATAESTSAGTETQAEVNAANLESINTLGALGALGEDHITGASMTENFSIATAPAQIIKFGQRHSAPKRKRKRT